MTDRTIEHASFTLERRYRSAPAAVFAAWADPVAKGVWFAPPDDWHAAHHELDFRVGGREVSRGRDPDGATHTFSAVYWDVVREERIVYTYELLLDETRVSVSLATIELAPDGGGTRLTITEHGAFFDGIEPPGLREHGTGSLLDALGRALER